MLISLGRANSKTKAWIYWQKCEFQKQELVRFCEDLPVIEHKQLPGLRMAAASVLAYSQEELGDFCRTSVMQEGLCSSLISLWDSGATRPLHNWFSVSGKGGSFSFLALVLLSSPDSFPLWAFSDSMLRLPGCFAHAHPSITLLAQGPCGTLSLYTQRRLPCGLWASFQGQEPLLTQCLLVPADNKWSVNTFFFSSFPLPFLPFAFFSWLVVKSDDCSVGGWVGLFGSIPSTFLKAIRPLHQALPGSLMTKSLLVSPRISVSVQI